MPIYAYFASQFANFQVLIFDHHDPKDHATWQPLKLIVLKFSALLQER
jgi:hypothetical protein